jgi:hypothetical protein
VVGLRDLAFVGEGQCIDRGVAQVRHCRCPVTAPGAMLHARVLRCVRRWSARAHDANALAAGKRPLGLPSPPPCGWRQSSSPPTRAGTIAATGHLPRGHHEVASPPAEEDEALI